MLEAFMRRFDSLKRAELKAQEESECLQKQERERLVEKPKTDLTLRTDLAAQADEKQLELLFFSGQSIILTFAPFYGQQQNL
ncbi:unnamed protein product [Sphagnum balticum]